MSAQNQTHDNRYYPINQARAAATLFEILRPFIISKKVTKIVDFICGDGSILDCLARRISADRQTAELKIELFGFDVAGEKFSKTSSRTHDTHCQVGQCPSDGAEAQCRERNINIEYYEINKKNTGYKTKEATKFTTALPDNIIDDKTAIICTGNSIASLCGCFFERIFNNLKFSKPFIIAADFRLDYMGDFDNTSKAMSCGCNTTHEFHSEKSVNKYIDHFYNHGYLKVDMRTYYHGQGALELFTFLRIDHEISKHLNEKYYTAVREVVRELFYADISDNFDGAKNHAINTLRTFFKYHFLTFGAAAIMPFDKVHTFARYCPVDTTRSDLYDSAGNEKFTMILEEPNLHQDKFHNAYGLYTAILAKITSPTIFSLQEMSDYSITQVDDDFISAEEKYFNGRSESNADETSTKEKTNNNGNNDEQPFFAIPVYYATLPIFVVVIKFPPRFDRKNLSRRTILEKLDSAHKAILAAMKAIDSRRRMMRNFIRLAASWQPEEKGEDTTAGGEKTWYGDEIEAQFHSHKDKPWKSWLQALPTQCLTDTDIVEIANETRDLISDFGNAMKFATSDASIRISSVFKHIKFFEGGGDNGGHEKWNLNYHSNCLTKNGKNLRDLSEWQEMLGYGDDNSFNGTILERTVETLKNLSSGEFDSTGATDTNFMIMKSMFCGLHENSESSFRFNILRLFGLIQYAGWDVILHTKNTSEEEIKTHEYNILGALSDSFWKFGAKLSISIDNDPSVLIAELAFKIKEYSETRSDNHPVKLYLFIIPDNKGRLDVEVEIPLPELATGGGASENDLIKIYQAITGSVSDGLVSNFKSKDFIKLKFTVTGFKSNNETISTVKAHFK
ncbi:MAG: hypothetical protein HYU59_04895 [Magnetospirillum gryphiswaldense]|nr:hypothetical protein [Magnetospirillum gryphiswaldense]